MSGTDPRIDDIFETLFGNKAVSRQVAEVTADRILNEADKLVEEFRSDASLTEPEVKGLLKFQRWLRGQRS